MFFVAVVVVLGRKKKKSILRCFNSGQGTCKAPSHAWEGRERRGSSPFKLSRTPLHPRVHIPPEFRAVFPSLTAWPVAPGRRRSLQHNAGRLYPAEDGSRGPRSAETAGHRHGWRRQAGGVANATGRPGPGGYDLSPAWQQRSLCPRLRPAQSSPTQSSPTQSSSSAPGLDKRFRLTLRTREGHARKSRVQE